MANDVASKLQTTQSKNARAKQTKIVLPNECVSHCFPGVTFGHKTFLSVGNHVIFSDDSDSNNLIARQKMFFS